MSAALVPFVAALGVVQPWLLKKAIDDYVLPGDTGGLFFISMVLLGAIVLEYGVQAVQTYLMQVVSVRAIGELRRRTFRHVLSQAQPFFDKRPVGSLLTRTTNDIEALTETLRSGLVTIFADVLTIIGIVGIMLALDWWLTLVSFLALPVVFIIIRFFSARLRDAFLGLRRSLARYNGYLQERLAGVAIVQLFRRQQRDVATGRGLARTFLRSAQNVIVYDSLLFSLMDAVSFITIALLLWYGAGRHAGGYITLGLLVAFVGYIQKLFIPIKQFSGKVATVQRAAAALDRIYGLLDTHEEIPAGSAKLTAPRGHISLDDVSFSYTGNDDVLRHVDLEVKPGEVVALVGATGSGKTTIGRLVSRTYAGYRGEIRIDGNELKALDPDSVAEHVGVVTQDPTLFRGTVAFNVGLGSPDVTRTDLERACQAAHVNDLVAALPGEYDFQLSDRGANLSAGERQLLTLARCFAYDPTIVLLDEATASVDPLTEERIQQAIAELFARKTVLVIAHRLSTVRSADRIAVVQRGEIVEIGSHDALLAEGGVYRELHDKLLT